MRRIALRGALAATLLSTTGLAIAGKAQAEEEWSANVGIATEYVWRGVTQSDESPSIWAGLDYANEYFYLGTWAATTDFGPASDATFELDLYGGFSDTLASGLTYDVGVIGYFYPTEGEGEDLNFFEVYGGLGVNPSDSFDLGAYAYYDPDNENVYFEGTAGYGITESVSVDLSVGSYSFDEGDDYLNWSVGATYSAGGLDFDLRYWDTDIEAPGGGDVDGTEERIVLSIGKTFG
ncbi:MAG: TorF family putative porin [Pseudomonadota bacterium]